ncbi:MAG: MlaD family protein [Polyangiaceae bacterium]|jgi:paraquat-inducible protein B
MANDDPQGGPEPQTAKVKPHGRFSPIWLIPMVAAGLVVYLGYSSFENRGPTVTLILATAEGLTVDETRVKHKAVTVGTVDDIALTPDMKRAVVKVRMVGGMKSALTEHARFWVIRPRISAGSLTGIETLVSGPYIEVDPGVPGGKKQLEFTALAEPPGRESDEPGHVYLLRAPRLGSLAAGSPIYYRDVEVGDVLGYELGQGLGPVTLRIFVREPFDRFVHPQTRFWNASGLSLTMGAEGMHLEVESIQTLLSGGIAFETPRANEQDPPAPESANFELFADKAAADAAFYRDNIPYVTYFQTSVQGLACGSPVAISGVQVGSVNDVKLVYDPSKQGMIARVAFDLQPERLLARRGHESAAGQESADGQESAAIQESPAGQESAADADEVRRALTNTRMRVVLESSNFLTGSKDLSIVYAKDTTAGPLPKEGNATVLPSQGGGIDGLTSSLADVATKVDSIPFDQIGANANAALVGIERLVDRVDTEAGPALERLPEIAQEMAQVAKSASLTLGPAGYGQNSDFQHDLQRVLSEVNDAVRSFRALGDYLDRHPEALIRGRVAQSGAR